MQDTQCALPYSSFEERVSSTISCLSSTCMSFSCYFFCCLQDAALNAGSPVLRLTRAGETAWGELPGEDWTIFSPNHSTYEPLAWATRNSEDFLSAEMSRTPLPTVLQVCLQLTTFVRDSDTSYQSVPVHCLLLMTVNCCYLYSSAGLVAIRLLMHCLATCAVHIHCHSSVTCGS